MPAIPKQTVAYDDRRNSSHVFDVPEGARDEAVEVCQRFADEHPAHARWLAAGAPSIRTEEDHAYWFGEPYENARAGPSSPTREYQPDEQRGLF